MDMVAVPTLTVMLVGNPRAVRTAGNSVAELPAASWRTRAEMLQRPASAACGIVTVARKTPFLAVPEIGVGIMLPLTSCLPDGLTKLTYPQSKPVMSSVIPRSTEKMAADELTLT